MTLAFDPNDPFPVAPGTSYRDAQKHAESVDQWLGLKIEETEAKIQEVASRWKTQQAWVGLPPQTLLTPYLELREMLEALGPAHGELVVDLGAGYGRMGFVLGRHFPWASWLGIELVPERAEEGNRCLHAHGVRQSRLEARDLTSPDFELPRARHFFIYDYGNRDSIERTLAQIQALASSQAVSVIGRGRATRDAIERRHPWLSEVVAPEHRGNWTLYRSAS